jgi:hypothetical protein
MAVTSVAAEPGTSDSSLSSTAAGPMTHGAAPDEPAAIRRGYVTSITFSAKPNAYRQAANDGTALGEAAGLTAAQLAGAVPGASVIAGFLTGVVGGALATSMEPTDASVILTVKLTTGELLKIPTLRSEFTRMGSHMGPKWVYRITGPRDHPVLEPE